jgi:hypothetical protein
MEEVVDDETNDISANEMVSARRESQQAREEEHRRIERELKIQTHLDALERHCMVESLRTVLSPKDFEKVAALPNPHLTQYANSLKTAFNDPKAKTRGVKMSKLGIHVPPSYIAVKLRMDIDFFKSALQEMNDSMEICVTPEFNRSIDVNPDFQDILGMNIATERQVTQFLAEHPKVELDRRDAANLDTIRRWIAEHR